MIRVKLWITLKSITTNWSAMNTMSCRAPFILDSSLATTYIYANFWEINELPDSFEDGGFCV